MSPRYFGTDGIRGAVGSDWLAAPFVRRVGYALGHWAGEQAGSAIARVVLGRDTRSSGPLLAQALREGLGHFPVRVIDLGVVPTPAVSWAVGREGATLGIVLTASHNPAGDNGIKLFSAQGRKLPETVERELENRIDAAPDPLDPIPTAPLATTDLAAEYRAFALSTVPRLDLRGWRVVVDTAHGATCATTPAVLRAAGAEVVGLGDAPDGVNINQGCGSEHPEAMARLVRQAGARLGLAHDGDGDRVLLADENGSVLEGDEMLALLGLDLLRRDRLRGGTLVATIMSNLGLDLALQAAGGRVERVGVGDRHVIEKLVAEDFSFGGESSGHYVLRDFLPTGDGLLAALQVLRILAETGRPLSELRGCLRLLPQATAAVRVPRKIPIVEIPALHEEIEHLQRSLGSRGRLLVRYSGTEPKIRLLVEAEDPLRVSWAMECLRQAVATHLS